MDHGKTPRLAKLAEISAVRDAWNCSTLATEENNSSRWMVTAQAPALSTSPNCFCCSALSSRVVILNGWWQEELKFKHSQGFYSKQGLNPSPSFMCNRRSNQILVRQKKDMKQEVCCPSLFSWLYRGIEVCCPDCFVGENAEAKGAPTWANLAHQNSRKVTN